MKRRELTHPSLPCEELENNKRIPCIFLRVAHSIAMPKTNLILIPTSRKQRLTEKLSFTKDCLLQNEKSGICRIDCPEYDQFYVGKTKRLVATMIEERIGEAG